VVVSTVPYTRPARKPAGPDRMPPANSEAERSLIGAVLLDPGRLDEVLLTVTAEDFWDAGHQRIWARIEQLAREGTPVDAVVLGNALEQADELEQIGGAQRLGACVESVPHALNTVQYAAIVREKAIKRRLISRAQAMLAAAYRDDSTAEDLVRGAATEVEELVAEAGHRRSAEAVMTCLADVQPEPISWLWPKRIARGKLTLLVGDPGLGKSFVTCAISATVTIGGQWPDLVGECCDAGQVVMLSAEDGLADTIRPRLDAAGADCRRVHALTTIRTRNGKLRPFRLSDGLPLLEEALDRLADVRLVVIDPVSAYLGSGADEHKNAEVRTLLTPLNELATRRNVAVVMVTHLNKGSGTTKAIYRATGSLAFVAAARQAWLFCKDNQETKKGAEPDPFRRLILPAKSNIVAEPMGLAYRLVDGAVQWEAEPVDAHADQGLQGESAKDQRRGRRGPPPVKTEAAKRWILEQLATALAGIRHGQLRRDAEDAGHDKKRFYDALDQLREQAVVEELEIDGRKWLRLVAAGEPEAEPDPDAPPY
jgi:hypothetical protein